MRSIVLGHDTIGNEVRIPREAFATHLHLIGGTGKGKTTAIHTMLHPLLTDPFNPACFFIIDRLGNFSQELLLWISSRFCTEAVRKRLVYIQPSNEDFIPTFDPLKYQTAGECYYRVERTTEIILRAWESQDIQQMPRLARWTFNAFMAAAKLGLTVSDCNHFVMPGSDYHARLLDLLPVGLQNEWRDITGAHSKQEAMRILDSSRNRLKPYFDSDILRRMFGSKNSRFDVLRMMREGKIVIVDLSPRNRLSSQTANTIGALILNEVLAVARSLPRDVRYPTYLLLDEFQNFVGPDIETALPEVRQLGLRLILSHQSFSQLERGDYDLTSMIFQAQSRMIFGVQGEDADLLAHEVASLNYDSRRVKEEIWTRRQLQKGNHIERLKTWSEARASADQWSDTYGKNWQTGESRKQVRFGYSHITDPDITRNDGSGGNEGRSRGGSSSTTASEGEHEVIVPDHEEFTELSNRTYFTFDEQKQEWAREIRKLRTGEALIRLVNDPRLYRVQVKRSAPGFLGYDVQTIARKFPGILERMDRMIEENFQSDFFERASDVDRESQQRIDSILETRVEVPSTNTGKKKKNEKSPFGM